MVAHLLNRMKQCRSPTMRMVNNTRTGVTQRITSVARRRQP